MSVCVASALAPRVVQAHVSANAPLHATLKLPAHAAVRAPAPASAPAPAPAHVQVAGELRGRLIDSATAQPIGNALIQLSGRATPVRTAADGSYRVRGLEPGSYAVVYRALGYAAQTRDVEITNGRVAVQDVQLAVSQPPHLTELGAIVVQANRDGEGNMPGVTVFTRADIERTARRDVAELLATVPGVVITQAGGPGQNSQISIRGSAATQVLVLLDGVALNSPTSGAADLSRIALANVEQVTVRTGAQSARYGARAMAGVVDIQSRSIGREADMQLRTGAFGERNVSAGAGGARVMGQAVVSAALEGDYRRILGDFSYDVPAVRGGGRATRANASSDARELQLTASAQRASTALTLRGTWQQTNRGMAGTIVQPSYTGQQAHDRQNAGVTAEGAMGGVLWTGIADGTRELGTFDDPSPPFGLAFHDTINSSGITASVNATGTVHTVAWSAGSELRTLKVAATMLNDSAPHSQQQTGSWATTRYARQLGTSGWTLSGNAGARFDRSSLSGDALSPQVGLQLSRGLLAASASVSAGYAPPTLADQFFHEGVQTRANPNLRAERTRRDAEGRLQVREFDIDGLHVSGDAAIFRADIDDMILWLPDFRYIWSPSNSDARRTGWELHGRSAYQPIGVTLDASLTRTNVTYRGAVLSGQVAYRPRTTGAVALGYNTHVRRAAVHMQVDSRYIGTRRTIAGSALNALTPYWMHDLTLNASLTRRNWSFLPALRVENLTNNSAAMLVDYPFPPRAWSLSLRVRRSASPPS